MQYALPLQARHQRNQPLSEGDPFLPLWAHRSNEPRHAHVFLLNFPINHGTMTYRYAAFPLTLLALASTGFAQCTFTPTIQPPAPILCPDESINLATEPYDAYQWYKDGSPIPGATSQAIQVSYMLDGGSSFTVEATLDGCTEMSASTLVDGWIFLPPYVMHGGDEPLNPEPPLQFCQGDTLLLTLSPGWTHNIIWTNNGAPIANESSPTLVITTPGSYTVSASTETCPNYVLGIGVSVDVNFIPPMQPAIVDLGTEICPYPMGNSTQWYLNGQPYSTEDCITPSAPGPYTVFVDYGQPCQVTSEPWLATGITDREQQQFIAAPVPADRMVSITWPGVLQPQGTWRLTDMSGRTVKSGAFPPRGNLTMDVQSLLPGTYMLLCTDRSWRPLRIVVAH